MWIIPSEFTEAIGRLGAVLPGSGGEAPDARRAEGRAGREPGPGVDARRGE